jgi:hypothetical protein
MLRMESSIVALATTGQKKFAKGRVGIGAGAFEYDGGGPRGGEDLLAPQEQDAVASGERG